VNAYQIQDVFEEERLMSSGANASVPWHSLDETS